MKWDLLSRLKSVKASGRTGVEIFIEADQEARRRMQWEMERRYFLDDIYRKYPRILQVYSEKEILEFWDRTRPKD